MVERHGGEGEDAGSAPGEAADGDAGAGEVVAGDRVARADDDLGAGVPEQAVVRAVGGAGIDQRDGRVNRGGQVGADLEDPEGVVLALAVEEERAIEGGGAVEGIDAGREGHAAQVDVAQVRVGRHEREGVGDLDEIEAGLAGDRAGGDDRAVADDGGRETGDAGGGAGGQAHVAVAEDGADHAGAGDAGAAEGGEVACGEENRLGEAGGGGAEQGDEAETRRGNDFG